MKPNALQLNLFTDTGAHTCTQACTCAQTDEQRMTYQDVVWQLFYSNHGQSKYEQTYNGLFAPPSPKEFLQSYFNIELP